MATVIGIIYGGTRGTGTPTFWTGRTKLRTFQNTGEEFAVFRGDLRRLNYTKTVFGQLSPRPRQVAQVLSQYLLNWYSPHLDRSYAPGDSHIESITYLM